MRQEAFATSQPLLVSERQRSPAQLLFLKSRSCTSMLKFSLFPNEQLLIRYGHAGHLLSEVTIAFITTGGQKVFDSQYQMASTSSSCIPHAVSRTSSDTLT